MMISVGALSLLVAGALLLTLFAPILLVVLFIRDHRKGQLW